MKEEKTKVNYRLVLNEIWKRRKYYFIVLPITFIIASVYIFSIPRGYSTTTKMAPEVDNGANGSTLGSIASSFGFDISEMQTNDAITPMLYPELLEDNGFISSLFYVKIETSDHKIKTDYYHYLKDHQQYPWWTKIIGGIRSHFASKEIVQTPQKKFDPYHLTKKDNDIVSMIRNSLKLSVDKKTGEISLIVKDQDAFVCKIVADATRQHLQEYITKYRTHKARKDYEYYLKLTKEAKATYEKARRIYGRYADSNTEIILQSYRSKQEDLENDMQLKFNTYSTLNTQLQAARAKIQEKTPAFTIVQGAAIPIKPDSPKRVIFIVTMLFVSFFATSIYVLRDIILPKE